MNGYGKKELTQEWEVNESRTAAGGVAGEGQRRELG